MTKPWPASSGNLFQRHQEFASGKSASSLLAGWSFAEAICWFILPDYLLLILATLRPEKAWHFVFVAIFFSTLGCLVMYIGLSVLPTSAGDFIFVLPFTDQSMLNKIQHLHQTHGILAVLFQPFSGVPAKVWTYAAVHSTHWPLWSFLAILGLVRGLRMALVALAGSILGRFRPGFLVRYWPFWLGAYSVILLLSLNRLSMS